jgi:hypothetical protein
VLQLKNRTAFKGALNLLADRDGIDTAFTIVKGTFTLEAQPRIADEQIPVTMASEHYDDPATSSIKRPSDISIEKPGTDVVLIGNAHALRDSPVRVHDVSLTVGSLHKTVRVFGNRRWEGNGATYVATAPEPFVVMPLVWERAFGGKDRTESGERRETRNPVGTGFRTGSGLDLVDGLALPNLEDPADLITSWKHTPAPAGFGPIGPHWEPRRSYAGTYDEQWQTTRAPYLPADFDPRFLLVAPPGLASSAGLRGGEPVDLRGVTPEGIVQFQLPAPRLRVQFYIDGKPNERPARLDTVILEPTERRFSMVWRASMPCDKKALRLSHVAVDLLSA